MKWLLTLAGAALLLPVHSVAAPVDCVAGTLDSYLGLADGCAVGAVVVSDFETFSVPLAGSEIAPDMVNVSPGGGMFDPSLEFTFSASAAAGEIIGLGFSYLASGALIGNDASLIDPFPAGDGAISLVETKCFGEAIVDGACPGSGDTLALVSFVGFDIDSGPLSFPQTSVLGVANELVVDGGVIGSAAVGGFSNNMSAVPEPTTFLLTGLGALTLAAIRRRRAHQ